MSSHNTSHVHIFAYGSNMYVPRIRARAASAWPVVTGFVPQRRFLFHKLSKDGSAKADAAFSASPDDRVWGVVFQVHMRDKPILDGHELLGIGYDEHDATVIRSDGKEMHAWLYVARTDAIAKDVKPYSWYKAFVIGGAKQHGLPRDYVRYLERFPCIPDADARRHATNHRLIAH